MKIKRILKRLLQLHPKSIDLSLNRIKRLLKDLNNPEKKITNAIQVVGTNGKHSFCSALREIFETAGYTVNLNISPSLRKFNERYYFSGKNSNSFNLNISSFCSLSESRLRGGRTLLYFSFSVDMKLCNPEIKL